MSATLRSKSFNAMNLTSTSLEKFLSVLRLSGLIEESVLNEVLDDVQSQSTDLTAEKLADILVDRNLITSWHGTKLLKGKHKGFFLGRYKLLRLLGRGGMSSVYLAEHTVMKRQCAIKVLPYKLVEDSSYLPRFYREAQAVAALDDPNIVRAYDVDKQTDGEMEIHFLVMEYVKGQNFYELVKNQGPLQPRTAADYIRQGALGLAHAHQAGMVHRDVKPGNFIVDGNGTVKLMDLGLAMVREGKEGVSVTLANEEKVLGTADYLAPEQAVDSHQVDQRADIYALGCTFFFLLTGRPPFDEGTLAQRLLAHQTKEPPAISEFRQDVPAALVDIISRMMVKDPEQRMQTALEVVNELQTWLSDPDAVETEVENSHQPILLIDSSSSEEAEKGPSGAISDFLAHLEESSLKKSRRDSKLPSGGDTAKSFPSDTDSLQKPPATSDSTTSVFHSGPSSIVSPEPRASVQHQQRRQRMGVRPINLMLTLFAVGFGIGAIYILMQLGDPPLPPSPPTLSDGTTDVAALDISGPVVRVGPDGDFRTITAAVEYIADQAFTSTGRTINEIRVSAGQTLVEHVVMDNTGLGVFPSGLKIIGEGPEYPVLTSTAGPVLTLGSIEHLLLANLQIDCTDLPVAVQISGYLSGTQLKDLTFSHVKNVAILGLGSKGLPGSPVSMIDCRFEAESAEATAVRFEESTTSNVQHVHLLRCRMIGPLAKGIVFHSPGGSTSDVEISNCIFHETQTGITFAGPGHVLKDLQIFNNTFHRFQRGILFESGPSEASQDIAFHQNLFAKGQGFEVTADRPGMGLDKLAQGGAVPQFNWTTGAPQDADAWLNIFEKNGRVSAVDVEFVSTDPKSLNFLKPTSPQLATAVSTPVDGKKYIGAVPP